jgi:hypothetical protein
MAVFFRTTPSMEHTVVHLDIILIFVQMEIVGCFDPFFETVVSHLKFEVTYDIRA